MKPFQVILAGFEDILGTLKDDRWKWESPAKSFLSTLQTVNDYSMFVSVVATPIKRIPLKV